jgi:hypothetical protein
MELPNVCSSVPRMSPKSALAILIGAAILILPAWWNGFPFVFPDSGDYLVLHPLLHRSPYYGLFIFFFHFNRFIWGPIIAQALIISHLLWLMTSLVGRKIRVEIRFLALVILLTLFSSLPFFVGFIMADICTPIMFLTMYIVAFYYRSLSRPMLVYLLLLDCVVTAGHITDFPLAIGLLALFFILALLQRGWEIHRLFPLILLGGPIALTVAAMLLFNGLIFDTWSLTPASQSFFTANLIAYGPGREYLAEACPKAHYKICTDLDRLPITADELLWSSGIFQQLGNFPGMKEEALEIAIGTAETRPGEVAAMIARNFTAGLMTHAPAAEFRSDYFRDVPSFPRLIESKFGRATLLAYETSAEMRDALPYTLLSQVDDVVFPLSSGVLIFFILIAARQRDYAPVMLAASTLAFIVGDTLLCTAISGVHDRYQARVTWLAPMIALTYALRCLPPNSSKP